MDFFANGQTKFSQFGHIARKYRLVNTVTASFNTISDKRLKCLSEKNAALKRYLANSFVVWHGGWVLLCKKDNA